MNKFRVLIAIVMVMTLVSSLMLVPAFADTTEVETADVLAAADDTAEVAEPVEHDHDGDGVADHDADAHVDDTTAAAVVEHDHDGDGIADHDASAHLLETAEDGWANLGVSDYIALVVAAVILVAFVVALILFVPKKSKQR